MKNRSHALYGKKTKTGHDHCKLIGLNNQTYFMTKLNNKAFTV